MANEFDITARISCEKCRPSTLLFGDVHFAGFDGESFDFTGEPGHIYNVLSDFNLQINALFRAWNQTPGTSIEKIGIKIGNPRKNVKIEINDDCLVKVDGRSLWGRSYLANGFIEYIHQIDYEKAFPHNTAGKFEGIGVHLNLGAYDITVLRCSDEVSYPEENPYFLNLKMEMEGELWPHGVVGQTADHDGIARQAIPNTTHGEGVIEGSYMDYRVTSLFADDCTYNLFGRGSYINSSFMRSASA